MYSFQVSISNRQNTSIHDHVVGHAEAVVQYAPEPPSVQAASCPARNSRLPQKHVKLSNKELHLCFIDWDDWNSSSTSCVTFWVFWLQLHSS